MPEQHYTYKCQNLTTGVVVERTTQQTYWSPDSFLRELNKWNASGTLWKYWTESKEGT